MLPALRPSAWMQVEFSGDRLDVRSVGVMDPNRSQGSATGTSNTEYTKVPLAAVGRVPQLSPYTMPYEITPYHRVKTYNASNFFSEFFYYNQHNSKGDAKPWLDRPQDFEAWLPPSSITTLLLPSISPTLTMQEMSS